MLGTVANLLRKWVFPLSHVANGIGLGVLLILVLLILSDVIGRRGFNSPITGTYELTSLGLSVITFLTLAYCGVKDSHIEMDFITSRLPKRAQAVISIIMNFLSVAILCIASWQLLLHAIKIQRMSQVIGLIQLPIYPFYYIAAFGIILLTLIFLIRLLVSFEEARK